MLLPWPVGHWISKDNPMPRRVTRSLLAATFIGALTLTACGAPASNGASNGAGAPVKGGELTVALDREVPTLDVANGQVAQVPLRLLANALYQPLMTPTVGGAYAPGMAKSLTADATATKWTLKIPPDVTFSDGSALTTDDIRAHIKRLADPKTASSSAAQAAQIKGMEIADETTMVFTLAAPNADFASVLARALGMVTSTEAKDKFGFPLGAGPYVIKDFTAGDSVTVVRNKNYWGEPAKLDSITFEMMPDADSRFQSLQSGDVDLIWTEVTSQFKQARTNDQLAVHAAPAAVSSLLLNLTSAKFRDVRVRTALAQAIDREAVNAVVNLGEGAPVDGPYSLLGDLAPDVDYPTYDPEAAREVLKDAGLKFTLTVSNAPDSLQRATVLKDMLGKVGVKVELAPVEAASYASTLASKDFEAIDFVTSIFSDPAGGAMAFASKGPYNLSGYTNDVVDTELAAANGVTDVAERAKHLSAVSKELVTDLPALWLTAGSAGFVGSSDLAGIHDLTGVTLISVNPAEIGWARK
ncbi:ABC transporter substrate-binding protein [Streptomyces sp. NPDC059118]|uniref:ABC transporter substrate-binding protein n=1 Tax=unclassified Streptomyces TaxID=2593676 RepID=UPI00367988E3